MSAEAGSRTGAGKVALITGASSGIGRAIAGELSSGGHGLCLTSRRADALSELAGELAGPESRPSVHAADLATDAGVRSLLEHVGRDVGRLDVLVHCAAAMHLGDVRAPCSAARGAARP